MSIGSSDADADAETDTTVTISSGAQLIASGNVLVDGRSRLDVDRRRGQQRRGPRRPASTPAPPARSSTRPRPASTALISAGADATVQSRTSYVGDAERRQLRRRPRRRHRRHRPRRGRPPLRRCARRSAAPPACPARRIQVNAFVDQADLERRRRLRGRRLRRRLRRRGRRPTCAGTVEVRLRRAPAPASSSTATAAVWLQALTRGVRLDTDTDAACDCFAGDTDARSDNDFETRHQGRRAATSRSSEPPTSPSTRSRRLSFWRRPMNAHGGAFVSHDEPPGGDFNAAAADLLGVDRDHARRAQPAARRRRRRNRDGIVNVEVTGRAARPARSGRRLDGPRRLRHLRRRHPVRRQRRRPLPPEHRRLRVWTTLAGPTPRSGATPGCSTTRRRGTTSGSSTPPTATLVTHLIDVVNGTQSPLIIVNGTAIPGPTNSPGQRHARCAENPATFRACTFEFDIVHIVPPDARRDPQPADRRHAATPTSSSPAASRRSGSPTTPPA